MHILKEQVVYP